jgi:hypothetical protein
MPFQDPHPYIHDIQNGASVELGGRIIGHVGGVLPQVDGLHAFRLIARVEIPFDRLVTLVTLSVEWIESATPTRVVQGRSIKPAHADWTTYQLTYSHPSSGA